jgi:hypothetical protein
MIPITSSGRRPWYRPHVPAVSTVGISDDDSPAAATDKQLTFDQRLSDLGTTMSPALSYIVPDECRDRHKLGHRSHVAASHPRSLTRIAGINRLTLARFSVSPTLMVGPGVRPLRSNPRFTHAKSLQREQMLTSKKGVLTTGSHHVNSTPAARRQ